MSSGVETLPCPPFGAGLFPEPSMDAVLAAWASVIAVLWCCVLPEIQRPEYSRTDRWVVFGFVVAFPISIFILLAAMVATGRRC